jgi:hypothetical protein
MIGGAEYARMVCTCAMAIVIIAAVVALFAGWHFSQAHMAHRAIPGRRSQLGPLRRDRTRHLIWAIVIVVLVVLVLSAIAH